MMHIAMAATLSLGSEAQRYVGLQRTQPKCRRFTTGLHGNACHPGLGTEMDVSKVAGLQ